MSGTTAFDNVKIYEALVAKVRKYGSAAEIGGRNHNDIQRLIQTGNMIDERLAAAEAARPLNEAIGRLHRTFARSMTAWRAINEKQEYLGKNPRLHFLNGVSPALLEPVEQPAPAKSFRTVDEYDAANAEASVLATELETRAQKISSYVAGWERSTPDQRNLSIILALADRLDRLEANIPSAKAE